MEQGIGAINEQVKRESEFVRTLVGEIGKVIVGQKYLIERLLVGLLADGHVLARRRAGAGQDVISENALGGDPERRSTGSSSRPTCCPPT